MRERGFTLLEVLIALAVFAISAAALLRQLQQGTGQQFLLEERTEALWLAEDRLAELAATPSWPAVGRTSDSVTVNGREWVITTEVQTTAMPELRRIEVGVRPDDEARASFVPLTLTTFRGQQ